MAQKLRVHLDQDWEKLKGGNLKGSEELLGQLQLQDNRVSELGQ